MNLNKKEHFTRPVSTTGNWLTGLVISVPALYMTYLAIPEVPAVLIFSLPLLLWGGFTLYEALVIKTAPYAFYVLTPKGLEINNPSAAYPSSFVAWDDFRRVEPTTETSGSLALYFVGADPQHDPVPPLGRKLIIAIGGDLARQRYADADRVHERVVFIDPAIANKAGAVLGDRLPLWAAAYAKTTDGVSGNGTAP